MRSKRPRAAAPALVLAVLLLAGAAGALGLVSSAPASGAPRGIHLQRVRDYAQPLGFLHVITGGGGQSLYDFRDPNDFGRWSAAHAKRYHLTVLEFAQKKLAGKALDTVFVPGDVFDA